jgi:hypothetical protein
MEGNCIRNSYKAKEQSRRGSRFVRQAIRNAGRLWDRGSPLSRLARGRIPDLCRAEWHEDDVVLVVAAFSATEQLLAFFQHADDAELAAADRDEFVERRAVRKELVGDGRAYDADFIAALFFKCRRDAVIF